MADTTVAAKVNETLDIHGHLTTTITLNYIIILDNLADIGHLGITEVVTVKGMVQPNLIEYLLGTGTANAMNIGQGNNHVLIFGQINACYTSQRNILRKFIIFLSSCLWQKLTGIYDKWPGYLSLALLMLLNLAIHPDNAISFKDAAVCTYLFNR